jgi:hypothetical protein
MRESAVHEVKRRRVLALVALSAHILAMSDLSPADKAILAKLLRDTIAADRFPLPGGYSTIRPQEQDTKMHS